jgi:hypothetical protein
MIRRTFSNNMSPSFLVDSQHVTRGVGGQIDWANVPVAYQNANNNNKKEIPAGKVMCELASGKLVPFDSPAAAAITKAVLLATSAIEDERQAAISGYGTIVAANVYENMLPDATVAGPPRTLTAPVKTQLNAGGQWIFSNRIETR